MQKIAENGFPVTWWHSVTKLACLKFCDILRKSVTKCDRVTLSQNFCDSSKHALPVWLLFFTNCKIMELVVITDSYSVSHMWQKQSWCELNMQKALKKLWQFRFPCRFEHFEMGQIVTCHFTWIHPLKWENRGFKYVGVQDRAWKLNLVGNPYLFDVFISSHSVSFVASQEKKKKKKRAWTVLLSTGKAVTLFICIAFLAKQWLRVCVRVFSADRRGTGKSFRGGSMFLSPPINCSRAQTQLFNLNLMCV